MLSIAASTAAACAVWPSCRWA
ncbi:hypothetical protein [Oceanicola sp. D3]